MKHIFPGAFSVEQEVEAIFGPQELQEKDERSLVGVTSRGGGSGKTVTLEEFGNDLTKAIFGVDFGAIFGQENGTWIGFAMLSTMLIKHHVVQPCWTPW